MVASWWKELSSFRKVTITAVGTEVQSVPSWSNCVPEILTRELLRSLRTRVVNSGSSDRRSWGSRFRFFFRLRVDEISLRRCEDPEMCHESFKKRYQSLNQEKRQLDF